VRTFATAPDFRPDGIALDAEGAVWGRSLVPGEVARIRPGGMAADGFPLLPGTSMLACALGGDDRLTLFLLIVEGSPLSPNGRGRIEMTRVNMPGAGLP
jgi:sugar lactone lactonase YvrE